MHPFVLHTCRVAYLRTVFLRTVFLRTVYLRTAFLRTIFLRTARAVSLLAHCRVEHGTILNSECEDDVDSIFNFHPFWNQPRNKHVVTPDQSLSLCAHSRSTCPPGPLWFSVTSPCTLSLMRALSPCSLQSGKRRSFEKPVKS